MCIYCTCGFGVFIYAFDVSFRSSRVELCVIGIAVYFTQHAIGNFTDEPFESEMGTNQRKQLL